MKKNLLYIIIGLSYWSCNNDNENIALPFTPQKETRATTYDYPDKDWILRDREAIRYMNQAWQLTKDRAAIGERRELGFYIYNHKSPFSGIVDYNIVVGALQYGPIVNDANQIPFLHYDRPTDNRYCGFFHTHHRPHTSSSTTPSLSALPLRTKRWHGITAFIVPDSYTTMNSPSSPGIPSMSLRKFTISAL